MKSELHEDPPDEKVESAIEWRDRRKAVNALLQEAINPRWRLDERLRMVVILAPTLGVLLCAADLWSRVLMTTIFLGTLWDAAERRAQRRARALIEYLEAKESLRKWREEHGFPDLD
tara:strand:+ start:502 stop:852 length:351 start_codon:yes stop_codon:yes gene_type:complete